MLVLNSDWLKPREVAVKLFVSLRSVRRWLADGRFPNATQTRTGRWWIPKSDLEGWVMPPEDLVPIAEGPSVYFVHDERSAAIKIGFTAGSVRERLSQLQTASPEPLRLLLALPGDMETEATLHARFSSLRIRGEWFRAEKTLLDFINREKARMCST